MEEKMIDTREVAVQHKGVKKMYKLGQIGGRTLTADLQSWWARIRKKEDPNVKIGVDQRLFGQTFMALNGIDLTIYKGEAIGIIGGNGAGKSTMLKLLSRVTAPTEGEIDIYGRIASMLEVGTGFNGEMTGRENVYLNGAILGMTKEEIDAKMEDIIEFSEVRDFIDTPVKRYSSGMYVKLAFSVAAHLDAEIMIMDEVLAVGDVNFQQKCLKKMREAAKEDGRTVLYVSHNMSTIRQLCDRCIVMSQGKIIYEGDVESSIEIYSNVQKMPLETFYDLSQKPRHGVTAGDYRMSYIEMDRVFLDKQKNFRIQLKLDCKKNSDCLAFRIVFTSASSAIATTYSQLFKVKKGESTVKFSCDASNLAPGKYVCDISVIEFENGTQTRHDAILGAFAISIVETEYLYNLKWVNSYYGYARLPFLTILDEESERANS